MKEFDESKHPRDDDGKFTDGNNSGKTQWITSKRDYSNVQGIDKNVLQSDNGNDKITKEDFSNEGKDFLDLLNLNVGEHKVGRLQEDLSEQRIIQKVGGGDKTTGSCVSVALCYIANKIGFDTLDFRGGNSQIIFANERYSRSFWDIPQLNTNRQYGITQYEAASKVFSELESGKEYICCIGSHCSIVRKTQNGTQYLELQSSTQNGWKELDDNVLEERFNVSTEPDGYIHQGWCVDVENFKECKEFETILGYINTNVNEQQKGEDGFEK